MASDPRVAPDALHGARESALDALDSLQRDQELVLRECWGELRRRLEHSLARCRASVAGAPALASSNREAVHSNQCELGSEEHVPGEREILQILSASSEEVVYSNQCALGSKEHIPGELDFLQVLSASEEEAVHSDQCNLGTERRAPGEIEFSAVLPASLNPQSPTHQPEAKGSLELPGFVPDQLDGRGSEENQKRDPSCCSESETGSNNLHRISGSRSPYSPTKSLPRMTICHSNSDMDHHTAPWEGLARRETRKSTMFRQMGTSVSQVSLGLGVQKVQESTIKVQLARLTSRPWYEAGNAAIILLNGAMIAWETEHRTQSARSHSPGDVLQEEVHFVIMGDVFCFIFVADLTLRMLAQGAGFFFSAEWSWNMFDIFVVLSAVLDSFIIHLDVQSNAGFSVFASNSSLLRVVRLLRIIRLTRAVRFLMVFRELRILVHTLMGASKSLIWSVALMSMSILIFGVFFTEGALAHCIENDRMHDESTASLRLHFGTLFVTMSSLFRSITGGDDWSKFLIPLSALPIYYSIMLFLFITLEVFVLLNAVTAAFVDSTIQQSKQDRQFVVQTEMSEKRKFMETMQRVFDELDIDGDEAISLDELQEHLNNPNIAAYLSALDLDVKQVGKLFQLIDVDRDGSIDRDEFTFGTLRLKGSAKSLDVAILNYEVRRVWKSMQDIIQMLEERLEDKQCHQRSVGSAEDPLGGAVVPLD